MFIYHTWLRLRSLSLVMRRVSGTSWCTARCGRSYVSPNGRPTTIADGPGPAPPPPTAHTAAAQVGRRKAKGSLPRRWCIILHIILHIVQVCIQPHTDQLPTYTNPVLHLSADVPSGSLLTLHRPALLRSSLYQTDASPPLPSVSLADRLAPFSFSPPCKPSSLFGGASTGGPGSRKSIFVTTYNCGGGDPEQLDLHEMMQVQWDLHLIYDVLE